jgi:RNA polymerase sigma factor (TIGR02999 family)
MADVTQLLEAAAAGDPTASSELLPLVYDELRKLAAARMSVEDPNHTLQPTALVHEAYLRLVGGASPQNWDGRGHFFTSAAEAMRRILVEAARRKGRIKHGGGQRRVDLDLTVAAAVPDDDIIAISEVLDQFAVVNPDACAVVKLRYFAGLSGREAADAIGVSPRKADQLWAYARVWILDRLTDQPG